jgi:hypothetical protein
MSFEDAKKILSGGATAATDYFEKDEYEGVDAGIHAHRSQIYGERGRHRAVQSTGAKLDGRTGARQPELQP